MKKILALVLAMCITMAAMLYAVAEEKTDKTTKNGFPSFSEGFPELDPIDTSKWGEFDLPEMEGFPEMPEMDTSKWGEFTMPEGWGDMDFGNFSKPAQGSWGDLGGNSDWGSAFEDMKKSMKDKFGSSSNFDNPSSEWPPQSFKDLASAFDQQKNDINNTAPEGTQDMKELFKEKFGDVGIDTSEKDIPPLDFAQDALGTPDLTAPDSPVVGAISSIANLNKINSFLNSMSGKIADDASFDNLKDFPNLGTEIQKIDMNSTFDSLAASLAPKMDPSKKYDGSLFEKSK